MRLRHVLLAGLAAAVTSAPAFAETVEEAISFSGWNPGDYSEQYQMEGLVVSFEARESPNNGDMYVIAEFCNPGSERWAGGMRVTDDRPYEAHSMLRVAPGDRNTWGEHSMYDAQSISMLVDAVG